MPHQEQLPRGDDNMLVVTSGVNRVEYVIMLRFEVLGSILYRWLRNWMGGGGVDGIWRLRLADCLWNKEEVVAAIAARDIMHLQLVKHSAQHRPWRGKT